MKNSLKIWSGLGLLGACGVISILVNSFPTTPVTSLLPLVPFAAVGTALAFSGLRGDWLEHQQNMKQGHEEFLEHLRAEHATLLEEMRDKISRMGE